MYQRKNINRKHLLSRIQRYIPEAIHILLIGDNMRIGIIFPVVTLLQRSYF